MVNELVKVRAMVRVTWQGISTIPITEIYKLDGLTRSIDDL